MKRLLLVIPLVMTGCSASLIGGRHQTANFWNSDENTLMPSMEAPSDVDLRDLVHDLALPDPSDVTVPGGGDGRIPPSGDENPPPDAPTPPPASDNAPPSIGGNGAWVIPSGGGSYQRDGLRWKPVSESDGKLVVLPDAGYNFSAMTVNGENGRETGRSNGNRQTWRFSKPGAAYGSNVKVVGVGVEPNPDPLDPAPEGPNAAYVPPVLYIPGAWSVDKVTVFNSLAANQARVLQRGGVDGLVIELNGAVTAEPVAYVQLSSGADTIYEIKMDPSQPFMVEPVFVVYARVGTWPATHNQSGFFQAGQSDGIEKWRRS